MKKRMWYVCLAIICTLLTSASSLAVPAFINYQGKLTDSYGIPLEGEHTFQFHVYDAITGGSLLWSEEQLVQVTEGIYNVQLGAVSPGFPADLFAISDLYLEVEIYNGSSMETLSPRQYFTSVAFAIQAEEASNAATADDADTVDGSHADALEESAEIDGDINTHNIDSSAHSDLQRRVSGICTAGSSIREIGPNGTVICETDDGIAYTAGTGLSLDGTVFNIDLPLHLNGAGLVVPVIEGTNAGNVGFLGGVDYGVYGSSLNGIAIYGYGNIKAVHGQNDSGNYGILGGILYGVEGASSTGTGVFGNSGTGTGVYGDSVNGNGLYGRNSTSGNFGILGGTDFGGWGKNSVSGNYGNLGGPTYGVYGKHSTSSNFGHLGSPDTGVYGESDNGDGVSGKSNSGIGVTGTSSSGDGVKGENSTSGNYGILGGNGEGVYGDSIDGIGVYGDSSNNDGVYGNSISGNGVSGDSDTGAGVQGDSISGSGVYGRNLTSGNWGIIGGNNNGITGTHKTSDNYGLLGSPNYGVYGKHSTSGNYGYLGGTSHGVYGKSSSGHGMYGESRTGNGVTGTNSTNGNYGILGGSDNIGVRGFSDNFGVYGDSISGVGVYGLSNNHYGVEGVNNFSGNYGIVGGPTTGVFGFSSNDYGVYGQSSSGYAGYFDGSVWVTGIVVTEGMIRPWAVETVEWATFGGNVSAYGDLDVYGTMTKAAGSFKIDHPLDPENKYLYHSFVESPDMMNIYNGNVILDENGEAMVIMPDWFDALNRDFRYQLTCIGGFAPVYIAEEISGNTFTIAGGQDGLKVSWMVTGIRQDTFANANRIPVEEDKEGVEQGTYLHPEAYGLSAERSLARVHKKEMRKMTKEKEKTSVEN